MYYVTGDPRYACYAESKDGIHWVKPALGLVEFKGAKTNNIVWTAPKADNFTVFKDPNPACRSDARYKAVAQGPGGLWAYMSADGLSWSKLVDQPILAGGGFDSQNTAFWDPLRHQYFAYVRGFQGPPPADKAAPPRIAVAM